MPKPCKRCGQPIASWARTAKNKRLPLDADGSPHFISCKRRAPKGGAPDRRLVAPKTTRGSGVTHVYASGNPALPPPWCDSLGAIRDFTAVEIAAGVVAVPLA